MKLGFISAGLLFLCFNSAFAQDDYGCDKCSMLREEYENAVSPEKEKIYEFFKSECLQTDTVFVNESGVAATQEKAENYQVVSTGKCIEFKEVQEFEKKTSKPLRSYQVSKKDTIYKTASVNPEFTGGFDALIKFLGENVHIPEKAKKDKVYGTVYVRLVVRKDGKVTDVKAIRGPSDELKAEAKRVISMMPDWKPGKYKNNTVSMYQVIPVRFALK